MQLVNGHTLFPHAAEWSTPPRWRRHWQTGIGSGLTGTEQRAALRSLPLHDLTVCLLPTSPQERTRLEARIDQALKSGLAAIPFFGKATTLADDSAAGSNTVTVSDQMLWTYAAGDYISLVIDDTTFDVAKVSGVVGNILTLDSNLNFTWLAGAVIRPLLFGKFTPQTYDVMSPWYASVSVTVKQLVSERNAQLGNVTPDSGVGVGHQKVGSTNVIG